MKVTEDGGAPWWSELDPADPVIECPGYWVRHTACGKAHDASRVEVLQRYSDCSRWKCPHCDGWCDDRPLGWGGNIVPLERQSHSLSTTNEVTKDTK